MRNNLFYLIFLSILFGLISCSVHSSTGSTSTNSNSQFKPWTPASNPNEAQERFYREQNIRNQKLLNDRYLEEQRRRFYEQQNRNRWN